MGQSRYLHSSPLGEIGWGCWGRLGWLLLVRLFLSVCKGKQLYSENNRFSGYWSNKFRKHHCNYLFYREISKSSLPKPLRREGMCSHNVQHKNKVQNYDYFDCWSNYSNKHVNLHANYPLSIVCPLYGKRAPLLSEGSGEAFYSQSQNHNHKITKRIFNV